MARKKSTPKKTQANVVCCTSTNTGKSCGGAIYGLGFIGAVIYYISTATTLWIGLLGVLKAIVWPAFLVFELLRLVGA